MFDCVQCQGERHAALAGILHEVVTEKRHKGEKEVDSIAPKQRKARWIALNCCFNSQHPDFQRVPLYKNAEAKAAFLLWANFKFVWLFSVCSGTK